MHSAAELESTSAMIGLWRTRSLRLTIQGLACFWFMVVVLVSCISSQDMQWGMPQADSQEMIVLLSGFTGVAVGIIGAILLSGPGAELGLVPLGSFGFGVSLVCASSADSIIGRGLWLFMLSASAGMTLVPLLSFLRLRSPREQVAASFLIAACISLLAALAGWALFDLAKAKLALGTTEILFWLGILTFVLTAYACWLLPEFLFRFLFWFLTHTIYRVRVLGRENLPKHGPGLLICNHVSYVDGFFLVASTHRLIRFVIWGGIANSPYLSWLARIMGVIGIASNDGPKALAASLRRARDALRNGELVCVFAEGQISRIGTMLKFKRGFEKVVQGVDAPIVPAFLDCVWGSIFSFQGGRFFWKWPKKFPYPVTVSFGKPMPPTAEAFRVRQAVQELGADSVRARKLEQKPLHVTFMREAVRRPWHFCMADSRGTELNFGKVVAGTIALSRVFGRQFEPKQKMVGVLLPPSAGGTLVNLALLTCGKVPINLNYTASSETIASCVQQSDIKTIISSPEMLKRLKLTLPFEATAIEEIRKGVGRLDKFMGALAGFVLPGWLTERWLMRSGTRKMDDLATIIFSSGSTGEPKGVMLSHHNVISNCEAVVQVIDPTSKDRILGLLPLFHSFGFIANLCVPFMVGAGAVYHNNPLDSKEVGELTQKYGGTILLATPTFLRSYTRKIPPEQLKTLRLVITGAEKLPREVADSFREKFGVMPMEGYGCTELSPVVAVNIPDFVAADGRQIGNKPGTVGHPIPGVAAKVVDPDSFQELPQGQNGLLLIKGPNVMQGYLGKPEMTAQVIRDGWYVTGDIANLDEEGFITITDRLSRFSKIGGEMVPHIRIEETIRQVLGTDDQSAVVAGVPDPTRGERLVVIHTPLPISTEELWQRLNASGMPKLWVPSRDSFFEVAEFPYLGSGKLDLRRIKEIAREFAK